MTIQKTQWSPDTCRCSIEYEWDDSVSAELRTHTMASIQKCTIHSSLTDSNAYVAVVDENQSKNKAIGLLISNVGRLAGKEDDILWRFNADRSITVSNRSLTSGDLATLNALSRAGIIKPISFSNV